MHLPNKLGRFSKKAGANKLSSITNGATHYWSRMTGSSGNEARID
jgi:hypothetical protein